MTNWQVFKVLFSLIGLEWGSDLVLPTIEHTLSNF